MGWTRCVVPWWLGPSMLGVGHPAHVRVLDWLGAPLGKRNRCPPEHSRRKGVLSGWVVPSRQPREVGCFGTCLHSPQILFHGVGAPSCHCFLLEHPCGNGSLVLGSPLTSPSHGPLYTPGYSVGSWLVFGLAAPETYGHIGLMSCEPAKNHGCRGLLFGRSCGPGSMFDTKYKSPAESTRVGGWGVGRPERLSWAPGQIAEVRAAPPKDLTLSGISCQFGLRDTSAEPAA